MRSDEDAFEAMVSLFTSGNFDDVIECAGRHQWKSPWASQASQALRLLARRQDPRAALALARGAIDAGGAPFDAMAVYLILLQINGLQAEAAAYVKARVPQLPANEVFLTIVAAEVAAAEHDWVRAYSLALAVLATDLDNLRALALLAIASFELGSTPESLGYAMRASLINPEVPMVALQLMRCHNKLGDYYAALAAYNKVGDAQAITPEMQSERGVAYARLQLRQKAIESFRHALESPRKPVAAIRGMLTLLADANEHAEFQQFVRQHEREVYGDIESLYVLGLTALNRGDIEQSAHLFKKSLSLNIEQQVPLNMLPWPVPEPRLRHDREQLDLLQHRGKLPADALPAASVLRSYANHGRGAEAVMAPAKLEEAEALRKALTDLHYCPDPPFTGKALGDNDYGALEDAYFATLPSLIVVDNFLSDSALALLREFCEEATVWRSYNNENGYVGTTISSGFAPRVLLAVADELRRAMPRVIGPHALTQAWAFKYDQRMRGINVHADFAVVNVNFWLTPNDACLDKETSGMVIYDIPAPRHWTFQDYNGDPGKMQAYITENNAQARRISYQENRCVVFDSTLLHTTSRFTFKPGYCNRRINATLLYGKTLNAD
ncbi:MAG: tetratricopeptide repeat protein [Burkholderiales bacterium]